MVLQGGFEIAATIRVTITRASKATISTISSSVIGT